MCTHEYTMYIFIYVRVYIYIHTPVWQCLSRAINRQTRRMNTQKFENRKQDVIVHACVYVRMHIPLYV